MLFSAALVAPLAADQNLQTPFRTTGETVLAAFAAQREVIQKSSAVVYDGRKEIAYGVVVSPNGDILTKASEIEGVSKLAVAVDQKRYTEVTVVGVDAVWDVAHLKVAAEGWVPVVFAPTSAVPQGTWVVANGATTRTNRRVLAGIISAKPREIPTSGGAALGVVLKQEEGGLEIGSVDDKTGAGKAGLKAGDILTAIDGRQVTKREDIAEILKARRAGERIKVTYTRQGAEATVEVELMAKAEMVDSMSRNDQMSGLFSERRSGFPRIIQHDILGSKSVVGGPLLDLEGRCIGMNIARANRAESFAIPVEELKAIVEKMLGRKE